MIRVYFSIPKCARNLHSLKKLRRSAGFTSNLKNYSVSVNKGVESVAIRSIVKDLDETETEIDNRAEEHDENLNTKEDKSILLSALSNLKEIEDTGKIQDEVKASDVIKVFEKTAARQQKINSGERKQPNYDELTKQIKEFLKTNPPKRPVVRPTEEDLQNKYSYNESFRKALQTQGKLSISESIKVLKLMAEQRNRPLDFLKQMSSRLLTEDNLNIKECSDILYCLAALHYHDEALLSKLTDDICTVIETNENSSVVGSIFRSLSILKYRNKVALELLIEWMKSYNTTCRRQDISTAIMALAMLNFKPATADTLIQDFSEKLSPNEVPDSSTYLNSVWSLCVLNAATDEQLDCVLSPKFLNTLQKNEGEGISFAKAVKLLNINGYACNIQKNYKGNLITNQLGEAVLSPKNKSSLIDSIIDALLNLMPSSGHVLTHVNSRYGFSIDAEFMVDAKGTPLQFTKKKEIISGTKIAVLSLGYFDMCQGTELVPDGSAALHQSILEAKGYKVLMVPYTEFGPNRRLIEKVQFLDQKIKQLAAS